MFIRLAIACALLGSVHSTMRLSSEEVAAKVSDKVQSNFYKYIDNRKSTRNLTHAILSYDKRFIFTVFKSDQFVPAGLAKAKSLQATSYSTTGFVKQSVFTYPNLTADTTCSSVSYVTGYAANVCFQSANYAFQFKLAAGASKCST